LSLQQTEGIVAAAAGVAVEGLVPKETKVHAEKAANVSVILAENAIVLLMLVEDHLRSRSQQFFMTCLVDSAASPASMVSSAVSRSNSLSRTGSEHLEAGGSRQSLSSDAGGLPVDVCISRMAFQCFSMLQHYLSNLFLFSEYW
jgi:phosphate uptake regulator